jgi:hypothetical protein
MHRFVRNQTSIATAWKPSGGPPAPAVLAAVGKVNQLAYGGHEPGKLRFAGVQEGAGESAGMARLRFVAVANPGGFYAVPGVGGGWARLTPTSGHPPEAADFAAAFGPADTLFAGSASADQEVDVEVPDRPLVAPPRMR